MCVGYLNNSSSTQQCGCAILAPMATELHVPHPLPAPLVELIAERFRILGEPMRITLLDALREGEATVQDLEEAIGASQQNVSKHLGVLLRAGIVARRKQGNFSVYSIADEAIFSLCEEVCGGLHRQVSELDALLKGA
jgi:DNA-binding transcriptional ArsR family regulator